MLQLIKELNKGSSMWKIVDWANNEICERQGLVQVRLEFDDFESGWDYLYERSDLDEEDYEEYSVIPV